MNIGNFNSLFEFFQAFPNEQICINHLEKLRWHDGVVSPFDSSSIVYNRGDGMYRCKNTGKNFNVRTGTIFHGSKLPLQKWFLAIWLVTTHKKGITSIQLAKDLGVTQKTSWFVLHRIRECFFCENNAKLSNNVELDETFVGGKNKNRHYDKKVKNSQGRSFKDKTPVLGMLERGGKLVCRVMKNTSFKQINRYVIKTVKRTATVFTDE